MSSTKPLKMVRYDLRNAAYNIESHAQKMSRQNIKYNFSVLGYHIDVGEYFRCKLDANYISKCINKIYLFIVEWAFAIKTILVISSSDDYLR